MSDWWIDESPPVDDIRAEAIYLIFYNNEVWTSDDKGGGVYETLIKPDYVGYWTAYISTDHSVDTPLMLYIEEAWIGEVLGMQSDTFKVIEELPGGHKVMKQVPCTKIVSRIPYQKHFTSSGIEVETTYGVVDRPRRSRTLRSA